MIRPRLFVGTWFVLMMGLFTSLPLAGAQQKYPTYKLFPLGFADPKVPISSSVSLNDSDIVAVQIAVNLGGPYARPGLWSNYQLTNLDPGNTMQIVEYPSWINNVNHLVGYTLPYSGFKGGSAFIDYTAAGSQATLPGIPPDPKTKIIVYQPSAINDFDQVIGTADFQDVIDPFGDLADVFHGILWTPTGNGSSFQATDLGVDTYPLALNNLGQIVGSAPTRLHNSPVQAFISTPNSGQMFLGTLSGDFTSKATSINDFGQVVGNSTNQAGAVTRPFLWQNGTMTALGTAGSAVSINNAGTILGYDGNGKPCFWRMTGGATLLKSLVDSSASGWTLTSVCQINNLGYIAGTGIDPNGNTQAFLLKPANVVQQSIDRVHFQTANQSLWFQGPGSFDKKVDWILPWSFGKTLGGFYDPSIGPWTIDPCFGLFGGCAFTVGPFSLGDTGAEFQASTVGSAGLHLHAYADTGSVNINCPVTVQIHFPDKTFVHAGDTFTIYSSYTVDPNASLNTTQPGKVGASADVFMKADSGLGLDVKALGIDLYNLNLIPQQFQHIDKTYNLFHFELKPNTPPSTFDAGGYGVVTGSFQLPQLGSSGGLTGTPGTLASSATSTFFTAHGSVTNLISDAILGFPLSADLQVGGNSWGLNAYLALLQFYIESNGILQDNFSFMCVPHIHLDIQTAAGVALPGLDFEAGQTAQLTMPGGPGDSKNAPVLIITPTISLPKNANNNTFTNSLSLLLAQSGHFTPFELRASGSALGYDLVNFDWSPVDLQFGLGSFSFNLLNDQFSLDGFQTIRLNPVRVVAAEHKAPSLILWRPAATVPATPAPTLYVLSDNDPETDQNGQPGSKTRFNTFVSQSTTLLLEGMGFTSDTVIHLDYFGDHETLTTRYIDDSVIQCQVPNYLFLLPGVARLSATNSSGTSNTIDLPIPYPQPLLVNAGYNFWASDPNFSNVPIPVVGENFIDRWDYYYAPNLNSKLTQPRLQRYWDAAPALTAQPIMPVKFPDFPYFDTDANGNTRSPRAPLPTVSWNGQQLAYYFEQNPSAFMPLFVPNSYLANSQIVHIVLQNPGPEGLQSNAITRLIAAPTPQLTTLLPTVPPNPGDPGFRLVVHGASKIPIGKDENNINLSATGFTANSIVYWNGVARPTYFISPTELKADISAMDFTTAGTYKVSVGNPATLVTGGTTILNSTNTLSMAITSPKPVIGVLDPATTTSASPAFAAATVRGKGSSGNAGDVTTYNLVVKGPALTGNTKTDRTTGFVPGSVVKLDGKALPTQFVSNRQVEVIVPETAVAGPATHQITVFNPGTGGGTSAAMPFTVVNAVPAITDVNPKVIGLKTTSGIGIAGSGFYKGSQVTVNGNQAKVAFTSSAALLATVPASALGTLGNAVVTVSNPAPGGGASKSFTITVVPGTVLTATNPVGSAGQAVTLSAKLTRNSDNGGVGNKMVVFKPNIGTSPSPIVGVTDSTGTAKVKYTLPAGIAKGAYIYSVAFLGDNTYTASQANGVITVH